MKYPNPSLFLLYLTGKREFQENQIWQKLTDLILLLILFFTTLSIFLTDCDMWNFWNYFFLAINGIEFQLTNFVRAWGKNTKGIFNWQLWRKLKFSRFLIIFSKLFFVDISLFSDTYVSKGSKYTEYSAQ